MRKHPYYDGNKKKKTDDISLKIIAYSLIGVIVLIICRIYKFNLG